MQLPELFVSQMRTLLGEEYPSFVSALEEKPLVSIRINPGKFNMEESELSERFPVRIKGKVPWCFTGFYLESRPSFTGDPLFHAGCYYVQEASSMFVEQLIKAHVSAPVCCLDLCAAPGGKSTHLSALLPEGSLLVSNEVIRSRSHILAENLIKWGNPSTIVTNNDPAEIGKIEHFFDVILADVPCSGEGMFRKDPKAIDEWSPANVHLCAERQRRIIADIWPSLKPGGLLIYSTCTYNRKENEENIDWISGQLGGKILSSDRFLPHRTPGEGFFIAVLQKSEEEPVRSFRNKKKKGKTPASPIPSEVYKWLNDSSQYVFEMRESIISAFPKSQEELFLTLKEQLKIVHSGIEIAEIKGKDLIPSHSLAMSVEFNRQAFPAENLDLDTALLYLRKESLPNPDLNKSRGYMIASYEGYPLGFVKNIGARFNNLYPQEWRIRKAI